MRKLANIFAFFKSTLLINLSVSVVALLFGGLSLFVVVLVSFGFVVSLVFKEVSQKNEYLFYYNNKLSKTALWLYSYFFTAAFALLIAVAVVFGKKLFG